MTTFVLVPGAGGDAWYWHRVTPLLERAGHVAVAVTLPAGDETAGLTEYADAIVAAVDALGDDALRDDIVLVAQSFAGFSAPLAVTRLGARAIVLLNAMTPSPGERPGDWWEATGQSEAAAVYAVAEGRDPAFSVEEYFLHDLPADVIEGLMRTVPQQADRPFADPWPLPAWPDVPTRFVAARHDRLFPLDFQRRVVAERLGIDVEEVDGGHLVALSRPDELVAVLLDE